MLSISLSVEGSIAILTMDDPAKLNALSSGVMQEIDRTVCDIDLQASVLVVRGCDRAFAAGVDISEIAQHSFETANRDNFINYCWEAISRVKIPVIAEVSGYALGGGFELALMCDVIIASENAKFGFPEVNLGLMPGMGGTQLLTKIAGPKLAAEIIMTGDFLSAWRAQKLGIVSRVVRKDNLVYETLELAKKIAAKPKISLKMIKEAIRLSQNVGLDQGVRSERLMFRSLFSTRDKEEKVANFLGERKNG
ncbi:MAG: enoyl-CoA hydratase/isomerase family protein [Holosporaceae bacterium]|jgi:enoyl-CoA hydratase/carnithine racemase|nr:enoyl-CoA hydratase/isomerase family protein [Holosporaceae bacterium]